MPRLQLGGTDTLVRPVLTETLGRQECLPHLLLSACKLAVRLRRMSHPIVLVHGLLGFSRLTVGGLKIAAYFRGIPEALRAAGYVVPEPPKLNPAGTIAQRAADLQHYLLDSTNRDVAGGRVHIIAHSMGGLDTRYMIARLGMAERIASLTTIGTPHLGSPIADLVASGVNPAMLTLVEKYGVNLRGISDLTSAACAAFNEEIADDPRVQYFAIAGRYDPQRVAGIPLGTLGLAHTVIRGKQGDNDGLVSVRSANFEGRGAAWTTLDTWDANHFRQVNWGADILPVNPADHSIVDKYLALAARIAALA